MFQGTHLKIDIKLDRKILKILAKALKGYVAEGKTVEQFEEDYGCKLLKDEMNYGIKDVKFHNDSYKTAFMLKYGL